MEISARNKMNGKITDIKTGGVMASVKIQVEEPGEITALITKESVEKLGLKEGDDATAIIKSTEIIVGKVIEYFIEVTLLLNISIIFQINKNKNIIHIIN